MSDTVVITDNSLRSEIEQAITELRRKQSRMPGAWVDRRAGRWRRDRRARGHVARGRGMTDEADEVEGMVIARVVITRILTEDNVTDHVIAEQADGYELGLAEALGMMRLAEDTLIRARMDEDE